MKGFVIRVLGQDILELYVGRPKDDGTNVHWWNPSQARKAATAQRNDEKKGFRWGQALAHVHVQTRSAGSFHLVNVLVTDTDSSESIVEVINTAHYMDD